MTIFGVPWDALALEHVEAFLADAGDEGLTWEAKGTELPRRDTVRKHVAGFANVIGGFLLLGVSGEPGAWVADGVEFPEEPTVWLGNVIRRLNPVPRHDVRAWDVGDGRHVAVVRVDSVAVTPCLTPSGEVFERVSGATVRVEDPATMRSLLGRGDSAREGARLTAARALGTPPGPSDQARFQLAICFAPTGKPEDIAARLFTRSFEETHVEIFEALPRSPLYDRMGRAHIFPEIQHGQDYLTVYAHAGTESWITTVRWDASATVSLAIAPEEAEETENLLADSVFAEAVRPAAEAAMKLVEAVGGYGRTYVLLRINASKFSLWHDDHRRAIPISSGLAAATWTGDDGRLDAEAIERMKREIIRALGIPVYEPEADSGA